MRQIPKENMEELKKALLGALAANTNLSGLRIVPPKVTEEEVEHAACVALMSLTKDWVKPSYIGFCKTNPDTGEMVWF